MTLRKTGKCEDCGEILYGDDYGASGHACSALNKGGTPTEEIALLNAKIAELEKEIKHQHDMRIHAEERGAREMVEVCEHRPKQIEELMQLWRERRESK